MDDFAVQAYHQQMNTFRLLFLFMALVGGTQVAMAQKVNQCTDASGRRTMTDQPCGMPAIKRSEEPRKTVEQIQAEDIFRARTMIREDGKPFSPEPSDAASVSRGQGKYDAF